MSAPEVPAPRVPALDGLRGVALLLVLLAHASNVGIRPYPSFDLSGCGRLGVFLFFVLSSYLLTEQLLREEELGRATTWLRYAVRRVLRVLPVFLVWVLVYFALRRSVPVQPMDAWTLEDVGRHLLLVRGDRHLWTIPIELRSYLAIPLVIAGWVACGRRWVPTAAMLVALGIAARLAWPPDYPIALGPYVPIFLFGSLVAVTSDAPWSRRVAGVLGCAGLSGLVLHVPALWGVDHRHFHLEFDRQAALCAALLVGVLHGPDWLRRPFASAPLRFVGRVSYSAYLAHVLVLVHLEGQGWSAPETCLAFLAATLAVGWVSQVALEQPFARVWARVRAEGAGERLATPGGKG
ncbi:MAG: acyltransferase [Planctomycetota bacterium]|nr:acyltransferase [Planctomycetota bacterium]